MLKIGDIVKTIREFSSYENIYSLNGSNTSNIGDIMTFIGIRNDVYFTSGVFLQHSGNLIFIYEFERRLEKYVEKL